jgi:hypothetical protein
VTLISEISTDEPARPRSLDQRIPRDLETIVLKTIAKDPNRRYQTAADVAEDLRRFLDGEPIKARRTSVLERTRLWCRRHKALAGLYLVLLLAAVGSSLAAVYLGHLLGESEDNRLRTASAEADGAEKLYESLVAQANASRFSHQVGQRFATLEAVGQAAGLVRERRMPAKRLDSLRNLAIAALALPDLRTLRSWQGFLPGEHNWDADDQFRLYARHRIPGGSTSLRRIETDEEIALLGKWDDFRFSPKGRFLLAHGDHRFRVWDVSRAEPHVVQEGEEYGFAFHPDGRHLLMGRRDGGLWALRFRCLLLQAIPSRDSSTPRQCLGGRSRRQSTGRSSSRQSRNPGRQNGQGPGRHSRRAQGRICRLASERQLPCSGLLRA